MGEGWWMLVLTLITATGTDIEVVEDFRTEVMCIEAGQKWKKEVGGGIARSPSFVCVERT